VSREKDFGKSKTSLLWAAMRSPYFKIVTFFLCQNFTFAPAFLKASLIF